MSAVLDRFSTSPTEGAIALTSSDLDVAVEIEQARYRAVGAKCINFAPVIAIRRPAGYWILIQGCCNDWNCPRCGFIRAKQEYGRIVEGARELDKQGYALHFMTLTCRGKELSLKEADERYMEWTNRLFDALRKDAKKHALLWCYVQVTERQKRGHAHSHLIITYAPTDAKEYKRGQFMPGNRRATLGSMYSAYLIDRAVAAGLGNQTDLTRIQSPEAVARYIAKYLFKDAQEQIFPKGWRRIRYTQNFPQLPEVEIEAFPVLSSADWRKVATLTEPVITKELEVITVALDNWVNNVKWIDNSTEWN